MFSVTTNIVIPMEIQKIDARTSVEAVGKVQQLLEKVLPLIINNSWAEIKEKMIIDVSDIKELGAENEYEN